MTWPPITDDIVERAARAAYEASVFDPRDEAPDWEHAHPLAKLAFLRSTRAALEAALSAHETKEG